MLLACVPMKIRERDGGARVCPAEEESERASFLLHAAISHGSSCFRFSCATVASGCVASRRVVIHATCAPPLPPPLFFLSTPSLSLSRAPRPWFCRRKKKGKKGKNRGAQSDAAKFKGRRSNCPGCYWWRYSSNEVSRSIGETSVANLSRLSLDLSSYVSRGSPFVPSGSHCRRNLPRSTLLLLHRCQQVPAVSWC